MPFANMWLVLLALLVCQFEQYSGNMVQSKQNNMEKKFPVSTFMHETSTKAISDI